MLAPILITLSVLFSSLGVAAAQQGPHDLQSRKVDLEVEKLQLEVDKLKEGGGGLLPWLTGVLGFFGGIGGAAITVWLARQTRLGALDQAVHNKRLESYPQLVKATKRLALYFPSGDPPPFYPSSDPPAARLGWKDCEKMGQALSHWYFNGGGLLLSTEARDAYFRLARALTRASLLKTDLKVPVFPEDAKDISVEKIKDYRDELTPPFTAVRKVTGIGKITQRWRNYWKGEVPRVTSDCIEKWVFADSPVTAGDKPSKRFQDYILLQTLSSDLRTKLTEDLRSRRRPS